MPTRIIPTPLRTLTAKAATLLLFLSLAPANPARAASKEMIELQAQVSQLLEQVQRLQSTVDSKFGLVQHLVEQSTDNVNQMNAAVSAMQQKLNTQSDSTGGKIDAVSGQVQSLNDSLDELKSRIAKLDKQMQDIQAQIQNAQSSPAPGGGGQAPAPQPGQPLGDTPASAPPAAAAASTASPAASQAPPLQETYQSGLRDYNAAKYEVASSEFGDVVHYYPQDNLAGNAQFYIGEIAYRQQKYKEAVKAYNQVLEGFSGSAKAPAAQLKKGLALIQLNQKDAGIHELRSLIQRYPQSPEASQGKSKLNAMGIRLAAR